MSALFAKKKHRFLASFIFLLVAGLLSSLSLHLYALFQLPDVATLSHVEFQTPMRVYTQDGLLMSEFGGKRRVPITYAEAPKALIQAILATEDRRFFSHGGVDFLGLLRASKQLLLTGRKAQGASTITMQVARNFFLTRHKTFSRKINEILLALKIEQHLSKEEILGLYLNKIFLGYRAYGVAAAAQVYYGKTLRDLTLPQLAMIAGLPKAPSRDNPIANPGAAKNRRNHVLGRMLEVNAIDQATYEKAIAAPVTARYHGFKTALNAPYVSEMVRDALVKAHGEEAYTKGLQVYTTIDSKLQKAANRTLREGLLAYDKRHGYRGPEANLDKSLDDNLADWQTELEKISPINGLLPAAVVTVHEQSVEAMLADGIVVTIPWEGLSWARRDFGRLYPGPAPKQAADILKRGDVIRVMRTTKQGETQWLLRQVPRVQGALVSMRPQDGAILALNGGFSYHASHFNRATQAWRQSGSCFKPFIYAAALEKGFTLATLINDAPIVLNDSGENQLWRPQNASTNFYGPTRLRIGLVKSRNLVSIRLLQQTGIDYARQYLTQFGFDMSKQPRALSLALGSGTMTPMQITSGYAALANGGYKVQPHLIDRIEDARGHIIYQAKPAQAGHWQFDNMTKQEPEPENLIVARTSEHPAALQIISPSVSFLINDALQDVIKHGTGQGALVLNRSDIAGKTGTTNDQMDAWFAGYNGNIVTTVWVGFDLGGESVKEYGVKAAMPIWIDFMRTALRDQPLATLPKPPSIVSIPIDPMTGLLAYPDQPNATAEYFRMENMPKEFAIKQQDTGQNPSSDHADQDLLNHPTSATAQLF